MEIINMEVKKIYYSAKDISEMLDISLASSYKIIRQMNEELKNKGYIIIQGKVPKAFFDEKWYGLSSMTEIVKESRGKIYASI